MCDARALFVVRARVEASAVYVTSVTGDYATASPISSRACGMEMPADELGWAVSASVSDLSV